MSTLPSGTKAAESFLKAVLVKGALAKAVALSPFFAAALALPIVGSLLESFITWIVSVVAIDPATNYANALAIAYTYSKDREAFDQQLIKFQMMDKMKASPELIELELEKNEAAMEKFVHRGPLK